jgi:hypothetical protein
MLKLQAAVKHSLNIVDDISESQRRVVSSLIWPREYLVGNGPGVSRQEQSSIFALSCRPRASGCLDVNNWKLGLYFYYTILDQVISPLKVSPLQVPVMTWSGADQAFSSSRQEVISFSVCCVDA